MKLRDDFLDVVQRAWLVFLLLGVVGYFSHSLPQSFATMQNFRNITGNQAVLGIVSLALIVPLTCGQFDLSLGSIMAFSQIVTAALLSRLEVPLGVAIAAGIVSGALLGLVNGLLVAKFRVNSLITTLGVSSILNGAITWYTGGLSILSGIPDSLMALGSGSWIGLPRPLYFMVFVAILVAYLLNHTPFGRYLKAIGINIHAARLVGLNVDLLVIASLAVAGALAGVAGVLLVARQGSANPNVANWYMLPALSAAFLGATAIRPGNFNVTGTLVAIYFLACVSSAFSLSGIESWAEAAFNGGALVIAVAVSGIIEKRRAVV